MASQSFSRQENARMTFRQVFHLLMAMTFVGTLASALVPLYFGSEPQFVNPETAEAPDLTVEDVLRQQERGFARVLEREPNNPVALEGLAMTRLELGDAAGAIAPLEHLVQDFPDRADYHQMLIKAQVAVAKASD